jgi:hypothetical protein
MLSQEEYNKCKDFLTDNDSSNYTLAFNKLKYKYYLTSTTYKAKSYEVLNKKESVFSDLAEEAEKVNNTEAVAFFDKVAGVFRAKAEEYFNVNDINSVNESYEAISQHLDHLREICNLFV